MPRPSTPASRPGRYLAALVALLVIMLAAVIGGDALHPGSWHSRFKVGLGLDLSSGTTVTLRAVPEKPGVAPSSAAMKQAVAILLSRVNGAGLNGATVQQQGSDDIVVAVPGKGSKKVLDLIGTTAKLRFRQVLLCSSQVPGSPSCAPSGSATTNPQASPSPSGPSPSASGTAPPGAPSPSGTHSPSRAPAPSRSSSASASPSLSKKAALRAGSAGTAASLARVGPAAQAAPQPGKSASPKPSGTPSPSSSASPSGSASASPPAATGPVSGDPTQANPAVLRLFNKLNCYDTNWQARIYHSDPNLWDDPKSQVVACGIGRNQHTKYLLAAATVRGDQLTGANAALDTVTNQWVVNLNLNGAATSAFASLTSQMFSRYYSQQTGPTSVLDFFAIVLDGTVQEAPFIQQAIINGQAQISGSFTQSSAGQLANLLKYGELQLAFKQQSVSQVTPQLGSSQLQAGLIAGLVGLLLVVIYSFIYYRGLGVVSVSSLAIAALLSWLTVVLLTKHAGFTLSLAGVAGLIVAIGITADSFVVFFERLRDEVREGRSLRAAVERGWQRARRTILVSDTVSFLAAALLYYFAIGDVKGFAFTLGLTTLIDVIVVFLFTKPMVTLLARTSFYGNGHRLSGLDPARLGARSPWRGSARTSRPATGSAATAAPGTAAPREA